jgi:tripartite-type tricarboxylate transporter receptor subunit TctC
VIGTIYTFAGLTNTALAQESFYKGKTIRLIVGLAPGGGFDAYSRLIARHIGELIPGHPTTVVGNMAGAATSRVALLRKAFTDTMKDPEFLADTQKAKLDLDPIDGAEIEKQVRKLFKLEPALVAKMKEILK